MMDGRVEVDVNTGVRVRVTVGLNSVVGVRVAVELNSVVGVRVAVGVVVRVGPMGKVGVRVKVGVMVMGKSGVVCGVDVGTQNGSVEVGYGVKVMTPTGGNEPVGEAVAGNIEISKEVAVGEATGGRGGVTVGTDQILPGWEMSSGDVPCHSGKSWMMAVLMGANSTRSQGA
jgi:hypothetical protein